LSDTLKPEPSKIPANAVLLLILLIVSIVLKFVVGPLAIVGLVVAVVWAAKVMFDLVRWLRMDKASRPKMMFPKKSALALLVVILAVVYFAYLIGRDLSAL
jgi:hypothetical protein